MRNRDSAHDSVDRQRFQTEDVKSFLSHASVVRLAYASDWRLNSEGVMPVTSLNTSEKCERDL